MFDKLTNPNFVVPVLVVAIAAIALTNRVPFIKNLTG